MSLQAYQRARQFTESDRATERRLIAEITAAMLDAQQRGLTGGALMSVLHRNREMWNTFAVMCGSPGNALPDQLRASIVSIALWVDRHTSDVMSRRDTMDALIEVNRALSGGLADDRLAA